MQSPSRFRPFWTNYRQSGQDEGQGTAERSRRAERSVWQAIQTILCRALRAEYQVKLPVKAFQPLLPFFVIHPDFSLSGPEPNGTVILTQIRKRSAR